MNSNYKIFYELVVGVCRNNILGIGISIILHGGITYRVSGITTVMR